MAPAPRTVQPMLFKTRGAVPAGIAVMICGIVSTLIANETVARWEPRDFTFSCSAPPTNPFQVVLSADVTGPNGVKLTMPGFYDGAGLWKVRVSAPTEGAWSLVTHCDIAELDGRRAAFTCVANRAPAIHGGVRIDPERPHQFMFEDGARFLPVGYECDWLWAGCPCCLATLASLC